MSEYARLIRVNNWERAKCKSSYNMEIATTMLKGWLIEHELIHNKIF